MHNSNASFTPIDVSRARREILRLKEELQDVRRRSLETKDIKKQGRLTLQARDLNAEITRLEGLSIE